MSIIIVGVGNEDFSAMEVILKIWFSQIINDVFSSEYPAHWVHMTSLVDAFINFTQISIEF